MTESKSRRDTICSLCGEKGHRRYDRKFHPEAAAYKCGICGESGHNARFHTETKKDETEKECILCHGIFPLDQFIDRATPRGDGTLYHCRSNRCRKCEGIKSREYHPKWYRTQAGRFTYFLHTAKARSLKKNLPCDLTYEILQEIFSRQEGKCYYTGMPLTFQGGNNSISLDRLDSSRGYTADNVVFTLWVINRMKNDSSFGFFLKVCRTIAERFSNVECGHIDLSLEMMNKKSAGRTKKVLRKD